MNAFFTIIKLDYLQRTRSYAFLITLCISLAIAYTFVPAPNAGYSTVRINNYIGEYNSAWFGYVTAMMTSSFLSLIGFYLINNNIKKDIETKVGQITASTKIGNFNYLLSKVFSNFSVLFTILFITFIMSIVLFFLYNDGYPFEISQFIKPYVILTIPALFLIAVLGIVFEVFLGSYSILQNIGFFFLFSFFALSSINKNNNFSIDLLGSKIVTHQLEKEVHKITGSNRKTSLTIGYTNMKIQQYKKFQFNGMEFPTSFVIYRIIWIVFGFSLIFISSLFFHRFNIKTGVSTKKKPEMIVSNSLLKEVSLLHLPKTTLNYGIISLIKTELILLFRKGKKWLWFLNIGGIIVLCFTPLTVAHQFTLPVLWFLQVGRLSEITTKEITNNVHYFAFASYKPLTRVLISQIIAGILLILFLAFPLLIRYTIMGNFSALLSIILGGIFLVLSASFLGIITQNKKLFEVLFFMITYSNVNSVPYTDYFGSLHQNSSYLLIITIGILILSSFCFVIRKNQLQKL